MAEILLGDMSHEGWQWKDRTPFLMGDFSSAAPEDQCVLKAGQR